ncbi:hypothetical protein IMCC3317_13590 [Kordia antarctica]|uniref:Uncharacterized protein n=1 Tax=Kordia antarctica TaxID=1218801 RepID=A0A7L4ZII1_9FLAO|nr:hypothetical protein [Kordia antarctica]QHI36006.1 hypothetical protein IMCC3317_13590 [Kordia antarctica]
MKKNQIKKLQLTKIDIAKITDMFTSEIKGGTDPVSPPMSEAPDRNGVCYAIK